MLTSVSSIGLMRSRFLTKHSTVSVPKVDRQNNQSQQPISGFVVLGLCISSGTSESKKELRVPEAGSVSKGEKERIELVPTLRAVLSSCRTEMSWCPSFPLSTEDGHRSTSRKGLSL